MQGLVAAVVVTVGVDLDHERETLDPFLRGEVCAQTVDCDEDLQKREKGRKKRFKMSLYMQLHFKSKDYVQVHFSKNLNLVKV